MPVSFFLSIEFHARIRSGDGMHVYRARTGSASTCRLFQIDSMKIFYSVVLAVAFSGFVYGQEIPLDVKQSSLKFTGHAFLHDFNGEAEEFTGNAKIDAQAPNLVTSAKIDIAAAKMTTFESGRDRNMFDWLHVETNPGISFELTRVLSTEGNAAKASKDHPAKFLVSGKFTLNKVVKPLETQALGWRQGKWLVVTGTTQVDTSEHGLPIIKQYFMTVDKEVQIDFHLVFDLPPTLQAASKL
jgi:polyisoprenoid-binding protein YceI